MRPIIIFCLLATLVVGVIMLVQALKAPPPAVTILPSPTPMPIDGKHDKVFYVLDAAGRKLEPVAFALRPEATTAEAAVTIVNELIRFSDSHANTDAAPFPPGTRLKGLTVEGDLVVVDFNKEFGDKEFWTGSEHEYLALRALVNSLTEFPDIRRVQIKVNGVRIESLGGHEELSEPLRRDESALPVAKTDPTPKPDEKPHDPR